MMNYTPGSEVNPFFAIMPRWFLLTGILISTAASIIASQALISGSFTLVSEAVSLNFWPKIRILNPTFVRGQVYLPFVNWSLCYYVQPGCYLLSGICKYGSSLWTGNNNYNDNDNTSCYHIICIRKVLITACVILLSGCFSDN